MRKGGGRFEASYVHGGLWGVQSGIRVRRLRISATRSDAWAWLDRERRLAERDNWTPATERLRVAEEERGVTVERPLVPLAGSGALTLDAMTTRPSSGASGAIRRFAGWVARGPVGYPMVEGIDYWPELADSPSQMETCFAIFANVLELYDAGNPTNEKHAERRAALWPYQYCTGSILPSEQPLEGWEVELY